jgi:hypothetical protein
VPPVEAKPVSELTWEEFAILYRERYLKEVAVRETSNAAEQLR